MDDAEKPSHPATVRMRRIRPDGSAEPFTIEEQWKQVADWHAFLEADRHSDYPVLRSLSESWDELDSQYVIGDRHFIERGESLRNVAGSPLSALFYFIDMGFYPPPELLLTLLDCWDAYEAGGGKTSLEEAFLGRSRQSAGNYAKRQHAKSKKFAMRWEFDSLLRTGMKRADVAEAVSIKFGGKPDADSILRMMRGFHGFRARAAKAEKKGD